MSPCANTSYHRYADDVHNLAQCVSLGSFGVIRHEAVAVKIGKLIRLAHIIKADRISPLSAPGLEHFVIGFVLIAPVEAVVIISVDLF